MTEYLLFITWVCFSYRKILGPRSWNTDRAGNARSVRKDRLPNILLYSVNKTFTIWPRDKGGQPSLKGLSNLEFKLVSWWITHRQDVVDRVRNCKQVPSSQGHLAINQTDALSNLVTMVLIPFSVVVTYCMILHGKSTFLYLCRKDELIKA